MDGDQKKKKQIIIIVACLVLAAVITFVMYGGGGDDIDLPSQGRPVQMLCGSCEAEYIIRAPDYRKLLVDEGFAMTGPGPGVYPDFICSDCGEKAAQRAAKCKECEFVYIPNTIPTNDYPDRCPDCGYSDIETRRGRR